MVTIVNIGEFILTAKGKITVAAVTIIASVAGWFGTSYVMAPGIKDSLILQYKEELNLSDYSTEKVIEILKGFIEHESIFKDTAKEYLDKINNAGNDALMQAMGSFQSISVGIVIAVVIVAICGFFVYKAKKA